MSAVRAMEAPPSIMSNYFGEDLTAYLEAFRNGEDAAYAPEKNMNAVLDTISANNVKKFARRRPHPAPVAAGRGNHQPRAGGGQSSRSRTRPRWTHRTPPGPVLDRRQ